MLGNNKMLLFSELAWLALYQYIFLMCGLNSFKKSLTETASIYI